MARSAQAMIYLGSYHLTDVAPGPLAVDYTALGLSPGQLPFLAHRIRARVVGMGFGVIPLASNIVLAPDPVNPHTTASIEAVPPPELQGTMDVDVCAIYGMNDAQETD